MYRRIVAFFVLILAIPSIIHAVSFRFILSADMRKYSGPDYDESVYFRGACEKIAEIGAGDFMIIPGDYDPPPDVQYTIDKYLGDSYLWYPAVGNHEAETPSDMEWTRNYNAGGDSLPYIVNIGPAGCEETTYSFDYENAHFVVINEYFDGTSDVGTDGDVVDALYNWLEADLAATTKEHVFVIGHEPAYPQPDADNGRLRHVGDSLDKYAARRDRFWALLKQYNVLAYVCGHTHNYSTYFYDNVWQIDVGHARGIGDTGAKSTFVVVDVSDDKVVYRTFRDNYDGGPYELTHDGYLNPRPSFTTLIPAGATWSYLDDGSDQGTAWKEPAFADTSWHTGSAQLGYGDGDEATVLSYGGNDTLKYITTYFRHTFDIADTSGMQKLNIELLRDDGAVVYLNGTEILRSNMPSDTIDYQTNASSVVGGSDEDKFYHYEVPASDLKLGTNTCAAEIHQISHTSSDISFDLKLTAQDVLFPVRLSHFSAHWQQQNVRLQWITESETNHAGYHIYRSSERDGHYNRLSSEMILSDNSNLTENVYSYTDHSPTSPVCYYKLEDISLDGQATLHGPVAARRPSNVKQQEERHAGQFLNSFPNPFNPSTTIRYQLKNAGVVKIDIFNVNGQLVKNLLHDFQKAGKHTKIWDGTRKNGAPAVSGTYFCQLTIDGETRIQKLLLIR